MKRVEIFFIAAVVLFAVVFCLVSVMNTGEIIARNAAAKRATTGVAGKARDVDVPKLERLMRQDYLSGHEAEFYKDAPD